MELNTRERLTIKILLFIINIIQPLSYKHELNEWIDKLEKELQ